jgi:bacillithiol biosynthesis cysteine-adding enzyme BshC
MPHRPDPQPPTTATGHLAGLAAELVSGRHRELLGPAGLVAPGTSAAAVPVAPAHDRAALARGLAVANASYGHPRTEELARRLADPATAVVVTGQQTGLFGGPLLSLVKAAAAARWAEALEAAGRPAVAVFWMATEDHDFAEVARATVLGADGPETLTLGEDPQPLAPVGLRTVGPEVTRRLEELAERFPSEWFRAWVERLAGWWRPEARFGEAFARTLVGLLGGRSPLLLDSMLPELKRAQQPHLAALVERRDELGRALAAREAELVGRGFTPQVTPQPGAGALFVVRGGERRRVEWREGGRWALRGAPGEWPLAELEALIADNPAAVSPGVLARPAVQDAVLGPTLFLVGPGELSYLPQAATTHEVLGVRPAAVALRPFALVFDERGREHLAGLGASLEELLARPEAIAARLAEKAGGGFVDPVREAVRERLETLRAPALELDAHLEKPFDKTLESVTRALDAFDPKVRDAAARSDELAASRLEHLRALAAPGGRPQERVLAGAWFAGRYGDGFAPRLADGLDLDARRLSVIDPA